MSMQGFDPNFELIRQALGSIEFFREIYASSDPSVANALACISGLRARAESVRQSNPHASALLENVAEGLDLYVGLKPLSVTNGLGLEPRYQKRIDEGGGGPANTPPDKVTKVPGG